MNHVRWNLGIVRVVVVLGWGAVAGNHVLPLQVNTGFFERRDALATASLDMGRSLDMAKAVLRGEDGKAVPFWFEPGKVGSGKLHWVLAGEVDSLLELPFELQVSDGAWPAGPVGDAAVAEAVRREANLVPNGGFEQDAEQKHSTIWKGERGSEGWNLNDYAWANRQLPDLKASARLDDDLTAEGETALKLVAEARTDARGATPEKSVVVAPHVYGPTIPLRPDASYQLSYRVRIAEVTRPGHISVSLDFLDADRKRVFPKNYSINRLQVAYGTARNLPKDYLNQWVTVARSKRPLPMVRYGRIVLGMSFAGTCHVDAFRVKETTGAEPVTVTVGTLATTRKE